MIRFIEINATHYLVHYEFCIDIKSILLLDTLSNVELSQDDSEELENKIIKLSDAELSQDDLEELENKILNLETNT
jgi:uncharacterized UBP type Zn finger protein